ncbi:MAG: electron transfer flavoprotein subunit beta/FixA family protein [Chloroflexi bacterium]|nr:electron transfer flavoprotein subunit beta/FixA family protein [Chloroflexota bacterium]
MHIVCCIKQVPDTTQVKIDPQTNTLIRTGVESICNPYDLVAVEAAVGLAKPRGGRVTVVSMGPPQAEAALRECLALGVDEAILLSDRAFAGADTLATSYALYRAIATIAARETVDLVICGKQAIDGDTAQTGPGLATRLGCNQFTYVSGVIELTDDSITVRREVEGGSEVVRGSLPALLTVELELGAPHRASLPELVRALRYEVKVWGARDISGEAEMLGLKGSPTSVKTIFAPAPRTGGAVYDTRQDGQKPLQDFLDAFFTREPVLLREILDKGAGHA